MKRLPVNGFLLFVVYWALAVVGLQWARVGGPGSGVWPAFGLSIAGLVIGGTRLWPAIFLGRFAASLTLGLHQPLWAELAIAAINAGADLLGALILVRVARLDLKLRTRRDVLWLAGGVGLSAAVSATLGAAVLGIAAGLSPPGIFHVWTGWCLGNLVAGLTLTPLVLSWWGGEPIGAGRRAWGHFVLCMASTAALAWVVFDPFVFPWLRSWHLFPVLIWAALAFFVRGASLALVIISGFALWGASLGFGPLVYPGFDPILSTQQFIAVISLTILLLAATSDERRRVETAARLAAIASSSPDAMLSCDLEGRLTSWNRGAERLFGWRADEVLGRPIGLLAPTDPLPREQAPTSIFHHIMGGGSVDLETVRLARDGTPIDVHVVGSQLAGPNGELLGELVVMRDIRERKQAEAALADEREALEILNRTGAALAAELDLDRIVQMVTDAGRELSGAQFGAFFYNVYSRDGGSYMLYSLSGAERSQFDNFGMPRATEVFAPTFKGEGVIRSDDILADPRYGRNTPNRGMPEGHLPVRSYLAVPVFSRTGDVTGGLFFGHSEAGVFSERSERIMEGLAAQAAIAIDNSRLFQEAQEELGERRRAEAALRELNETLEQRVEERTRELLSAQDQLRQAQKMEAIGQLTGGVAHDFNNLLTIIRSSVDLLRRRDIAEDRKRRYIDAISDTADRAAKLTAQLLAFARRQALKPEVFDAPERVKIVCDMIRTVVGSRIRIEFDIQCDDCFIEADIAQFETALINIAVNARDAMDGEGRLSISARAVEGIPADPWHEPVDGPHVAISIGDTGRGIPPELMAQIFEPFFTTKEVGKGSGLGLSQVYGFVRQSDGEVQLETAPEQGSTFRLRLPLSQQPALAPARAEVAPRVIDGGTESILLVEDDPTVLSLTLDLLTGLGYDVATAANAAEALALLRSGTVVDLLFTDVVMPGGVSGVSLARTARELIPGLAVLLTSGFVGDATAADDAEFPLLDKPYETPAMAALLRKLLDARPAGAARAKHGWAAAE
ncbi:MAG: PAS domain S-box protein [Alphaproteobacteria bacterium]|nr:PAS domain S-box protein [Alphaproteobacteria bacterium]